jgi:tRNA/rRNA methyltransferase
LLDALFDPVHIVLLRPRWANNLGSVARAMKNFGLRRLTLVDSRIGSWTDAWKMAVHSKDVLENAKQAGSLDEVVASSTWIVGTTNEPLQGQRVLSPRELAMEASTRSDTTLLFGGEINGLEPAELLRCHAVSVIPTAPEQSSLNLAQAVAVFAAELFAERRSASSPPAPSDALATAEMMQHLERALAHLLDTSAWRDASRGKHAIAELMQPMWRAQLTDAEVRAWLVALNKAAQR